MIGNDDIVDFTPISYFVPSSYQPNMMIEHYHISQAGDLGSNEFV